MNARGSTVERQEAERIARTEALYREVNERIAEAAGGSDGEDATFVCECADADCTNRIEATLDEYETVRADATAFLLCPGHADERVEAVVDRADDHEVVRKHHPQVEPVVRELDPRR
jgi:hypothetical protein